MITVIVMCSAIFLLFISKFIFKFSFWGVLFGGIGIIFIGCIVSMTDPVYGDLVICEEKTLLPIATQNEQDMYLIVSKQGNIIYKMYDILEEYGIEDESIYIMNKYGLNDDQTDSTTTIEEKVRYFEDNVEVGVLQKLIRKPILTNRALPVGETKEEYVFIVPKGSIIK